MKHKKPLRGNKFSGPCERCGQTVPPGKGYVRRNGRGGWIIRHPDAEWVGVPCGGSAIGKPGMGDWVGGCPKPQRTAEVDSELDEVSSS